MDWTKEKVDLAIKLATKPYEQSLIVILVCNFLVLLALVLATIKIYIS